MHTEAQLNVRRSDELFRRPALPLARMFSPQAIALVGAREKEGSVGRTILENLRSGGFKGAIYPVNPKRHRILGVRAYPSIESVPQSVDLAIIATPAATVPEVIRRMRQGARGGSDRHFGRLQGMWRGWCGVGGEGPVPPWSHAHYRPELPWHDGSPCWSERDVRSDDGTCGQCRFYQSERRALHSDSGLESP